MTDANAMKFVCERDELAPWLKRAASVADEKSPIAHYGHVKLDVSETHLTITAANPLFQIAGQLEITDAIPGSTCVRAERISDLVAALRPDYPVEATYDGNRLHIHSARTKAALDTLDPRGFPVFSYSFRNPQIIANVGELDRVLGKTIPAMGDDEDRVMLWGLSLQFDRTGISAASCNGTFSAIYRLHHDKLSEFPSVILPRPLCAKLQTLLKGATGTVAITITPSAARFVTVEWTIISKLLDGNFPNHSDLIAPTVKAPVIIDGSELSAILARIDAAVDLDNKKLKQRGAAAEFVNGTMQVRDGHSVINDLMEVVYGDSPPAEIGFNTAHMSKAISAIDAPEIELHFSDRNSRIRLCAKGELEESFTTMPYRI